MFFILQIFLVIEPITRIDTSRRRKPKAKMNLAQAQALVYKAKIDHTVVEDDSNPHIDDFNMYSLAKAVPAEVQRELFSFDILTSLVLFS